MTESAPDSPNRPLDVALALVAAAIGWVLASLAVVAPIWTDSGIFASGGLHVVRGGVPYGDVWDSKPPLVFVWNALALAAGDGEFQSVRWMERGLAAASSLALFLLVRILFRSPVLGVVSVVLFGLQFFSGRVFEGGNLTEEYGAQLALFGALAACVTARRPSERGRLGGAVVTGVLFSLAVHTKEPFVLTSLPWLCLVVFAGPRSPRLVLRRALASVVGALLPFAACAAWLYANGALGGWFDAFSYHGATTGWTDGPRSAAFPDRLASGAVRANELVFSRIPGLWIVTLLGAGSLAHGPTRRRTRGVGWVLVCVLVLDFLGTLISPRGYGHYYLQLVPSFVLVTTLGLHALVSLVRARREAGAGRTRTAAPVLTVAGAALLIAWAVHQDVPAAVRKRWGKPDPADTGSAVVQRVRATAAEGDLLWATSGNNSRYYVLTGLLSPTRYFFVYAHVFVDTRRSTADEKLEQLREDLRRRPPRFVVIAEADTEFLRRSGLLAWVEEHYERTDAWDPDPNAPPGRAWLHVRR